MKIWRSLLAMSMLFFLLIGMVNCSKKKGWVAKIEGDTITLDDFNVRFEYYLKSKYVQQPELIPRARNSMEERKAALKDMINEKLILKEAKKMKTHEKEEVKDLIKLYTQQIILNAYIEENLAGDIQVAEEEIDAHYDENKAEFRNMDPDFARRRIKTLLMMKKYDAKIMEILDSLKNKYRIEENESAIRPIISETNILPEQSGLDSGIPMPQIPEAKIKTPDKEQPKEDTSKKEESKKEEEK